MPRRVPRRGEKGGAAVTEHVEGGSASEYPFLRPLLADQQYLKFAMFFDVGRPRRPPPRAPGHPGAAGRWCANSSIPIAMASAWSRRCKPSSCRRDCACGAWSVRGRPVPDFMVYWFGFVVADSRISPLPFRMFSWLFLPSLV